MQRLKTNELALIDLATGGEAARLTQGVGYCQGAEFAPDGKTLVFWLADHDAHVWDLKSREELRRFEFYDSPTKKPRPIPVGGRARRDGLSYSARLSPDGKLLAYGSQDGYLAIHEVATGKLVRVVEKLADGPCFFAFTPDGRTLAWAGWSESAIHLTEVATGQERLKLDGHKGRVYSLSFAGDGNTLVSSSQDATGLVWEVFGRSDPKSPLAAKELDASWADLAGDAAKAFQATRKLLRSPTEAVPYLAKRVRAVPEPDAKQVAAWLADLDSDSFEKRKAANAELEKLGELAAEPCRRALANNASLEARKRLEKLLAAIDAEERDLSPERLRALRAVEALERIGTTAARRALKDLAAGAAGARLTREAKAAVGRIPS